MSGRIGNSVAFLGYNPEFAGRRVRDLRFEVYRLFDGADVGRIRFAIFALLALAACRGTQTSPTRLLPQDADLLAATRPASDIAGRLAPVFDRLPEGAGAADLLRSLTGVDVRQPERCRESGLDPSRGLALAWKAGTTFLVLPVLDNALAGRRLGLRLARLGFLEADEVADGVRRFRRGKAETAALRVTSGLALVCVSPGDGCAKLPDLLPPEGTWSPDGVSTELGLEGADIAGVVRNAVVGRLLDGAGLTGTARTMAAATLGNARFAVRFDRGVRARVALGVEGTPLSPEAPDPRLPEGTAFLASVAVPSAFTGDALGTGLVNACRIACPSRMVVSDDYLAATGAAWNGRAGVAILAGRPAGPSPLLPIEDLIARLGIVVAAGFGAQTPDVLPLLHAATGAPVPEEAVPGRGTLALPQVRGLKLSVASSPGVAVGVTGRDPASVADEVAAGARDGLAAALTSSKEPVVLSLVADPDLLMVAAGGIPIEFIRHTLGAIRRVAAEARFDGARLTLDAAVVLR